MTFDVTYEIVTEASAEIGDIEERGYICEGVSLRDAIEAVRDTRTSHVGGVLSVEADEYPVRSPRWVTIVNGVEYLTGAYESRSLHLPDSLTTPTKLRICKFLGV